MKHYFFVNPVAGKGNQSEELIEEIKIALKDTKSESVIIMTEPNRGSEARARAIAEGLNGEPARFYACGGDGTANEIASAVIGFDGIELGIIPIGSGNDMIRNFQDAGDFMSVRSQLNGKSRKVDVMKYTSRLGNEEQTGLERKSSLQGLRLTSRPYCLTLSKREVPVLTSTRMASKSEKERCFSVPYQMVLTAEAESSHHHRQ